MSTIISFYLKDMERRNQDENAYLTIMVPSYKADTVKEMITKAVDSMEKEEGKQFNEFTLKGYLGQLLTDVNIPYRILPQRMVSGDNHIWQLALATKSYYFYQDTDCRDDKSRFLMYDTGNSNDLAVTGALAADGYQKELLDVLADIKEAAYLNRSLGKCCRIIKWLIRKKFKAGKRVMRRRKLRFIQGDSGFATITVTYWGLPIRMIYQRLWRMPPSISVGSLTGRRQKVRSYIPFGMVGIWIRIIMKNYSRRLPGGSVSKGHGDQANLV